MRIVFGIVFLVLSSAVSVIQADILTSQLSPSIENGSVFIGNQHFGGQLAVARAPYNGGENIILVAISSGNDYVKLYKYDEENEVLTFLNDIFVDSGIPFDISFIQLPMNSQADKHWCLVIPRWDRSFAQVDIYDVETCTPYFNCISNSGAMNQAYHVSDLGNGTYAISAEDIIYVCNFNEDRKFVENGHLEPEHMFYGASSTNPNARAYETQIYDYSTPSIFGSACVTTMHNAGIRIWDPDSYQILSRIGVGQHGGSGQSYYDDGNLIVNSELGDVHRAAVLHGGDFQTSAGTISSRLLFFSNHTMGFMIYDISKPESPQFVWQWDNDIRLGSDTEFYWHGAGCDNKHVSPHNDPGNNSYPGDVFGIGLRSNRNTNLIHLYIADCTNGLLVFDFSCFLSPFGTSIASSNYRSIVIDQPVIYSIDGELLCAHDLRTLELGVDGPTLVFTTWKVNNDPMAPDNYIGLSVHLDGTSINTNFVSDNNEGTLTSPFMLESLSPNPVTGSQHLVFTGCTQSVNLMIYNSAGRLEEQRLIENNNGQAEFTWNCNSTSGSRLPAGTYYLRAECGSNNSTSKIIILN